MKITKDRRMLPVTKMGTSISMLETRLRKMEESISEKTDFIKCFFPNQTEFGLDQTDMRLVWMDFP